MANVAVANISLAGVDKHQIPRLQEGGATIRTLNSHIVQSWLSAMLKRYESVNPQKYVYFCYILQICTVAHTVEHAHHFSIENQSLTGLLTYLVTVMTGQFMKGVYSEVILYKFIIIISLKCTRWCQI